MANGDLAALLGWSTVAPTDDKRLGWDEINYALDRAAEHRISGTHPISSIINLSAELSNRALVNSLGFPTAVAQLGVNQMGMYFNVGRPVVRVDVTDFGLALQSEVVALDSALDGKRDVGDGNFGGTPIFTPHGRANPVTSSFVVAYINGDGRIGFSPSSLRFKTVQEDYVAPEGFLDIQPVIYTVDGDDLGSPRVGFVAEWVNEVEPLLVVHEDGQPFSIRYEAWAVALHDIARRQRDTITSLEERLAALEQKLEGLTNA